MEYKRKVLKALEEHNITIFEYVYLQALVNNIEDITKQESEINAIIQKNLRKKDLLSEYYKPTTKANMLLKVIEVVEQFPDQIEGVSLEDRVSFAKWWNTYPNSDAHGHFFPTRGLRVNDDECFSLYKDLLDEGFKPEDLLNALKREIAVRKQNSVGQNNLKFMPKSDNYLRKKAFLPWLEENKTDRSSSINVNVSVYGNLA